jgi:hypothetical protein
MIDPSAGTGSAAVGDTVSTAGKRAMVSQPDTKVASRVSSKPASRIGCQAAIVEGLCALMA